MGDDRERIPSGCATMSGPFLTGPSRESDQGGICSLPSACCPVFSFRPFSLSLVTGHFLPLYLYPIPDTLFFNVSFTAD